MNFLKRLFYKRSYAQCPRCLGKGHVDENDIKRLKQELKWLPGKCAYCNGTGNVELDMLNKIPVEATYLTADLSEAERKRVIKGDQIALEYIAAYDATIDRMIKQILDLYFTENLETGQIADYFLQSRPEFTRSDADYFKAKNELQTYIEKVIAHITNK